MSIMPIRPRRLRQSGAIRRLVQETAISAGRVLVEMQPGESPPGDFGGIWMACPEAADDATAAVQAARSVAGDGCLAVDLRTLSDSLPETALKVHAAGADLVAVDGVHVQAVREALETAGAVHTLVAACASFPLDAPTDESILPPDAGAWVQAGADFVLFEPALPNLDRIRAAGETLPVPIAARCTPQEVGSYAAAFERGWLDGGKIPHEVLLSVFRAGARIVVAPASWASAWAADSP
jgi:delta-aminolevulinic acid dehydratase/porphobilinogen synthase